MNNVVLEYLQAVLANGITFGLFVLIIFVYSKITKTEFCVKRCFWIYIMVMFVRLFFDSMN